MCIVTFLKFKSLSNSGLIYCFGNVKILYAVSVLAKVFPKLESFCIIIFLNICSLSAHLSEHEAKYTSTTTGLLGNTARLWLWKVGMVMTRSPGAELVQV